MTCYAETLTLIKSLEQKLTKAKRKIERNILKVIYKDRKTNIWVRENTKLKYIITTVKEMKWRWLGRWNNGQQMDKQDNNGDPRYGKRLRGRPKERWRDEIDGF